MIPRSLKLFIACCGLLFISTTLFAYPNAIVNVPVVDMHKQPGANTAVISQDIYGANVDVVNKIKSGWTLIGTHDYYTGWVLTKDLVFKKLHKPASVVVAHNLSTGIYQEPSMTQHKPLMVPYLVTLPLIEVVDQKWAKVRLPDGSAGYMRINDIRINPKPLTLAQMVKQSRKFVGVPYMWGGASTYGFDCSGFVQMLYKQMGIGLPRDAGLMEKWPGFTKVNSIADLRPGDVMLMGFDGEISHAGMYLGNSYFINATDYLSSTVKINSLNTPRWRAIFITGRRLAYAKNTPKFKGSIERIPAKVKTEMLRYTWKSDCPVPISKLRYLHISYWGFDKKPHQGVLIVHENLAPEVIAIFKNLYMHRFHIQRMKPMYMYKGNDEAAMLADNTSAFNCRHQTDFPKLFSPHSYGAAIDINTMINPYINGKKVDPESARKYVDRKTPHIGKITADGLVVKEFSKYGWTWGGSWSSKIIDYQHFEKNPNS